MLIEERFSDYCDLCGAQDNGGLFAVYNDKVYCDRKCHICSDCLIGLINAFDEVTFNLHEASHKIHKFFKEKD